MVLPLFLINDNSSGFGNSIFIIPPGGKEWVDYIRDKGDEATHEIAVMTPEDAERLITFTEMLLKLVYEFPASLKKPGTP